MAEAKKRAGDKTEIRRFRFPFYLEAVTHLSRAAIFRHMMTRDRQSFITQFFCSLPSRVSLAHLTSHFPIPGIRVVAAVSLLCCAPLFSPWNPSAINFILRQSHRFFAQATLIFVCLPPKRLSIPLFFRAGSVDVFKNASNLKGRTCLHLCTSFPSRIDCLFDVFAQHITEHKTSEQRSKKLFH